MSATLNHLKYFMLTQLKVQLVDKELRKQEILKKWEESANYPRKKKKRVRKELTLDWQIACWNPFEWSL